MVSSAPETNRLDSKKGGVSAARRRAATIALVLAAAVALVAAGAATSRYRDVSKESSPHPPEYFPGAHRHSHQWLCIFWFR